MAKHKYSKSTAGIIPCEIPGINKKVAKVYQESSNLLFSVMAIFGGIAVVIELILCDNTGLIPPILISAVVLSTALYIPYRRQIRYILACDTFYIVRIKKTYRGYRNTVYYYFDYEGKQRCVNGVGGLGYVKRLPTNGSALIVGRFFTVSGREQFCCALPYQIGEDIP